MPEQILYPEWRRQNQTTHYPFSSRASLTNAAGRVFVEGLFIDAALYPIGAGAGLYLSSVAIDHETVLVTLSDPVNGQLATGEIPLINPPDDIVLTDAFGRPAGILVGESQRLSQFQSWGVGLHTFLANDTEFAATVCFPTPEVGVRGIRLDSGELFVGDVWMIGSDGVVLRREVVDVDATCNDAGGSREVIRVDVVGDPLFRRQLCVPASLFEPPRFIRSIMVVGPNGTLTCEPDAAGNIAITGNNHTANDTVLRIVTTPAGLRVSAVGQQVTT